MRKYNNLCIEQMYDNFAMILSWKQMHNNSYGEA